MLGDDSLGQRGHGTKAIVSAYPAGEQRIVQTVAYPDAAKVEHIDRGNAQTTYVAIIDYQFDTIGKCDQFLRNLGNTLADGGVIEESYDGGGQASMEAALASWEVASFQGAAVIIRYTFLGGRFTPGPASKLNT